MEDTFKVRVERLFGSRLFETVPKSSFPEASWSVTDGEVERRQWNRERGVDPSRDDAPCASAYDDPDSACFPRPKPRSLDGDDEGESAEDEERLIRASVGLDTTLDREEEEDEYDRAAVGKEDVGDRMYMRDVNDHGPFRSYHSVLDFFEDTAEDNHSFQPDPRADHFAANVRLKEDRGGENSDDHHVPSMNFQVEQLASKMHLKPILKRKGNPVESRPKKQVRFNPVHDDSGKDSTVEENILKDEETLLAATKPSEPAEDSSRIPDYIRNPSKYICYSFDTSDENDDELNRRAFEDFRSIISRPQSSVSDTECVTDLPKSVVFTPRKKATDAMVTDHEPGSCGDSSKDTVRAVGVAAGDAGKSEACAMDEDEANGVVEEASITPRKTERKYRAKASSDSSES